MKNQKPVVLIQPSMDSISHRSSPRAWTKSMGVYPPLGLLYLAGSLEALGIPVRVLDLNAEPMRDGELLERLSKIQPRLVGVTLQTLNLLSGLGVCETVKKACPEALTVVGGPHPSAYPKETAALPFVDYAVMGHGESPLYHLATRPHPSPSLPGIYTAGSGHGEAKDADRERQFPARHLIRRDIYWSIASTRMPMTTVVTGSGCPFSCVFCPVEKKANPYFRSVESVIEELSLCRDAGFREIMFMDDIFTLDRNRILNLCEGMRDRGFRFSWDCRTRVDCVDSRVLSRMKEAGCFRIQYGLESGSDRVLALMKKGFDTKKARETVEMTRKAGILPSASFMIGNPGETESEIQRTIAFAMELKIPFAQFNITTPAPFTPLYDEALRSGFLKSDYWREFAAAPKPGFIPEYYRGGFSDENLRALQKKAFYKFYFRPRQIFFHVSRSRNPAVFFNTALAGWRLLRELAGAPGPRQ